MKKDISQYTCDGCSVERTSESFYCLPAGWFQVDIKEGSHGTETFHLCETCKSVRGDSVMTKVPVRARGLFGWVSRKEQS
jgi:hypothetical protein